MINTLGQPKTALILFGAGAACGVVFALISLWRYCAEKPKIRHLAADFLFSAGSGLLFLFLNFRYNSARLDLFAPIVFVAGVATVYLTLKTLFKKFLPKIKEKGAKLSTDFKNTKFGKFLSK